MSDPLEAVLRMVADGRLSAEEAGPIIAALDERTADDRAAAGPRADGGPGASPADESPRPRSIRLEVTDGGRVAVNLRLPAALGDRGLEGVLGLTRTNVDRIRAALAAGARGPIFEALDEDGDGVRIVLD